MAHSCNNRVVAIGEFGLVVTAAIKDVLSVLFNELRLINDPLRSNGGSALRCVVFRGTLKDRIIL
uniref:Uncharacterized protein n=1 Tax=Lepeophtheirus salmonis TaxID=72036 RepID=A0A0K2UNA8_LEPSM